MMNCGQESGDQENLAATSLATRWLAAILQEDCAWQEGLEGGEEEPVVEGEGTERLLDNQVKGEHQHKNLLVESGGQVCWAQAYTSPYTSPEPVSNQACVKELNPPLILLHNCVTKTCMCQT